MFGWGKARRKARRAALAKALRAATIPVMRGYGYDNPPKGQTVHWPKTRLNTWMRTQGSNLQDIHFFWDPKGQDWFKIYFYVENDDCREEGASGSVISIRRKILGLFPQEDTMFTGRDVERSVDLAIARLIELEDYFRTGHAGPNIYAATMMAPDFSTTKRRIEVDPRFPEDR